MRTATQGYAAQAADAPLAPFSFERRDPGAKDVAIDILYCGVCHSDLHIWEGRYDLGGGRVMNLTDRGLSLPIAMGHEIIGRVVKLGPDATGVAKRLERG